MAQADAQIQNDNGSNVRADLNNNFDALFSNNSGSSEPSVTTAFMWFADSANDALKIRNAADSAFITVGTLSETNLGLALKASPAFTGNVTIPAGTVSSLPLSFTGDTDTGFFKNSANEFSIVTGGTRRAHFDSNGITLTLPASDGNADDVLQTDGSGNLSFTALPAAVPTGSVHMMAANTVPSGYLKCNGQAVSRTTFAALFLIIGTTYGAGDGSSTFNVPDLRGEFVRGWDDGRGVDAGRGFDKNVQASQNAQHNHIATATTSISPSAHNHLFPGDDAIGAAANNAGGWTDRAVASFTYDASSSNSGTSYIRRTTDQTLTASTSVSVANDGSTDGSRPRNVVLLYVIKT